MDEMQRIIFNDRVDAALVGLFLAVVLAILFFTIRSCIAARRNAAPTACEIPANLAPAQ
jgi:carbon starvation protein